MENRGVICVVPTVRTEMMESFKAQWSDLFHKHNVTLISVLDGDDPLVRITRPGREDVDLIRFSRVKPEWKELICRKTDAVRNLGFLCAAQYEEADFVFTADDDVHPPAGSDPIQEHLDVLNRRVPISWMNTSLEAFKMSDGGKPVYVTARKAGDRMEPLYLRGFPYGIRDEALVMVSHGVWVNVPDFDGRTQLELTANGPQDLPYSLPYFRGPVPKGCYMSICGMNLMVRKEALPYLYFAPMGPDSGVPNLHRFSDIWMGLLLKRHCDAAGWAIYTGASTVVHTRASDPHKNVEQEKLGIEWNEWAWQTTGMLDPELKWPNEFVRYWRSYLNKAARFRSLIRELQGKQ